MTQQRHIIKQQTLELHISSDANSFELQNRISVLYSSQVVPLIDAICTQLSSPDTTHRIDRLEIDLGEIEAASLETGFVQKVAEVLSKRMSQMFAATTVQTTQSVLPMLAIAEAQQPSSASPAQTQFERFREFLQTGRLPWWSKPLNRHDLEECFSQLVADSPDKLRVLLQSSLKQNQIIQRILYQFSESMRMEMLKLLAPALLTAFRAYLEDLQRLFPQVESLQSPSSQQLSQTIWQGLFLHLALRQSLAYPTTTSEIDAVLRANLLHIATQLNLDGRSLMQQLITTLEKLNKTGINFAPDLIHLLERLAIDLGNIEAKASITSTDVSNPEGTFNQLLTDLPNILRELLQNSSNQRNLSQFNLLSIATLLNPKQRSLIQQLLNPVETSQFSQDLTNFSSLRDIHVSRSTPETSIQDQTLIARSLNASDISLGGIEDIYLQNAGVVLLWSFLNHFFEILGLVESKQFPHPQAAHRATLFLQYLVDASLESLESSLPLNKILCGLDLSEPMPTTLVMTEDEQSECETVLLAAMQNWSALGTISTAGLRQAFLQRAGILRSHQEGWLLQVEHKTHDILLDHLPWSIHVIKLPWMTQVLHTEW